MGPNVASPSKWSKGQIKGSGGFAPLRRVLEKLRVEEEEEEEEEEEIEEEGEMEEEDEEDAFSTAPSSTVDMRSVDMSDLMRQPAPIIHLPEYTMVLPQHIQQQRALQQQQQQPQPRSAPDVRPKDDQAKKSIGTKTVKRKKKSS